MMAIPKKRGKVDYHETLRDVARSMVRLKKPERLLKLITHLIDQEFNLTHTSLLVFQENKNSYAFVDSKGTKRFPMGFLRFDVDHPFVSWFSDPKREYSAKKDFLLSSEIKKALSKKSFAKKPSTRKTKLEKILRAMNDMKAELVVPGYFKDSLLGLLLLGKKQNNRPFLKSEIVFFQTLAQDCSMAVKTSEYHQNLILQNKRLFDQLKEIESLRNKEQKTYYEIMRSLAREVDAKDPNTFGHLEQVEKLGLLTAQEMGLPLSGRKKNILLAGLALHDVGKIGIPDFILNKPGKLDEKEWVIMQGHVEKGAKILEPLTDFKEAREIILSHHERMDGMGYPRGLKGDQIPMEARVVSVVDAFHAIVGERCYCEGRSLEKAIEELKRCSGTQFDPEVVEAFLRVIGRETWKTDAKKILIKT